MSDEGDGLNGSGSIEKNIGKNGGGAPVLTLDERRRAALAEVDNAKFSWFHIKILLIAGVGFFTDAYDIFAVSQLDTMRKFSADDAIVDQHRFHHVGIRLSRS
jgi:hypothetical protein